MENASVSIGKDRFQFLVKKLFLLGQETANHGPEFGFSKANSEQLGHRG